ncbi:hypothetical protein TVAG_369820 [Trichomonas vaginalis G3]|uniref:Uncharacterized protein n=1 Tax=Trichomonas vaginalis (strain ATCC PRA-98 / G3) TaxID=412133 RepID=A2FS92_TRIV3|eukprot:XP_001280675.1 hypothetical protein [Trichomonas vaginalis G3]
MDGLNDYKEVNGPQTYPDETEHCEISLIDYRDNREIQLDLSNCRQEIVQSLQEGLYDKAYDIFMQLDPEIQNTFYCELKENTDIDK